MSSICQCLPCLLHTPLRERMPLSLAVARDVTVTSVMVNHGKSPNGEGYLLTVTTHAQGKTCSCYVVKKTWWREDVTVAVLTAFFCLQREPNLNSGRILVIIRMLRDSWLRMAALSAGAARGKLLRRVATHPIYLVIYATITLNC